MKSRMQYVKMLLIFIIVQVMAVIFASQYLALPTKSGLPAVTPTFTTTQSVLIYIIEIAVVGVALAVLFKYGTKLKRLKMLMEFLTKHTKITIFVIAPVTLVIIFMVILLQASVSLALSVFMSAIVIAIYYGGVLSGTILAFLSGKFHIPLIPFYIVFFAFVGTLLGLAFTFDMALLFFVLLAVYDFIAVFVTKHMIVLAKTLMTDTPKTSFFGVVLNDTKLPDNSMALGSGDLMMPAMVAVSALMFGGLTISVFIVIGAILGLLLTFVTLDAFNRPLPAIPFLAAGIFFADGCYRLFGKSLGGLIPALSLTVMFLVILLSRRFVAEK